ncbi:MAG: hypothetical protein C0594_05300 [Marinilabiliales bacterium]|nr:MAG: hypothetical protein C0594_05300 [Marinilabiliales bacterium]
MKTNFKISGLAIIFLSLSAFSFAQTNPQLANLSSKDGYESRFEHKEVKPAQQVLCEAYFVGEDGEVVIDLISDTDDPVLITVTDLSGKFLHSFIHRGGKGHFTKRVVVETMPDSISIDKLETTEKVISNKFSI